MGFVNFDRYADMTASVALAAQTIGTNTTTAGATIDCGQGGDAAKSVTFIIGSGTVTDGAYALQVFESSDSGMSGETQITDRIWGDVAIAAADDDTVTTFSVKPNLRYIRVKVVSTSVTTGGSFYGVAVAEKF